MSDSQPIVRNYNKRPISPNKFNGGKSPLDHPRFVGRPLAVRQYCGNVKLNFCMIIIFERIDDPAATKPIYDVEIYAYSKNQEPPITRIPMMITTMTSSNGKTMYDLTRLMKQKFHIFQAVHATTKIRRRYAIFTHICHDFDWIKSIIDVELDYHLGAAECLRVNTDYLVDYTQSITSGYGEKFYNISKRTDISDHEFALLFGQKSG